jgi:hypothetical protein
MSPLLTPRSPRTWMEAADAFARQVFHDPAFGEARGGGPHNGGSRTVVSPHPGRVSGGFVARNAGGRLTAGERSLGGSYEPHAGRSPQERRTTDREPA